MRDRSAAFRSEEQQRRIKAQADRLCAVDFFNVLTGPQLLEKTEALLPEHRERQYPPTVTLSMFLKQALEEDRSCEKAVNDWIGQRVAEGAGPDYSCAVIRHGVPVGANLTWQLSLQLVAIGAAAQG